MAAQCSRVDRQQSQPYLPQEAGTQKEGCRKDPGESELSVGASIAFSEHHHPHSQLPEGGCVQDPHTIDCLRDITASVFAVEGDSG